MSKSKDIDISSETNIILVNLSQDKLKKVLELCKNEGIHYTFDKDYYSNEYYDINQVLEEIICNNNKVPIVYKELIENEFRDCIEDSDDSKYKKKMLKKIENIQYEN